MKHTFFKRTLALVLAGMMAVSVLVACGDSDTKTDAPTTTAPTAAETTVPVETADPNYDANGFLRDSVPDDLDFGDTDFQFLAWKQTTKEYFVEEPTGEVIDNAIYNRNMAVEERLGVKLHFREIPGNNDGSSFKDFCQTVMTSVNANAQAYDAIACYLRSAGILTLNSMLLDLMEIKHLDFEKPWWSDSLVELNSINNHLYFMSGDIATSLIYMMQFMIWNNELGTNLGLENPQKLAIEGKWTQDKMIELATGVYADLNGDGKKSADDQYGLFSYTHPKLDIFYMGAGLHYVEPDSEGKLAISPDCLSEKAMNIIDKLNTLYTSNDGYFIKTVNTNDLIAARCLMYNTNGEYLQLYFRQGDMSYSILPAPKYDESQEDYMTTMSFTHSMYCIPLDARDPDMTGAVLECMASEGYRKVTPALFETAFKYQYSNNQYDADIFEIIREGIVFDIGRPFFDDLGGESSSPIRVWRMQIENGNNSLITTGSRYEKMWLNSIKKINDKLAAD